MGVPTFQVASVTIKRPGARSIRAERGHHGRWTLATPVTAPARPPKIESLLAALSSLRVVDGEGVRRRQRQGLRPFGLSPPTVTVELTTTRRPKDRWSCTSASPFPTSPIASTSARATRTTWSSSTPRPWPRFPRPRVALRSQQVADIDPAAVTEIEIQNRAETFALKKRRTTGS